MRTKTAKPAKAKKPVTITAYKGFDKDWKCRDFQFELGRSYTHGGPVKLCSSGFHACEAPLDCLFYYSIVDGHFAEVELGGVSDEKEHDTKRVGSSLNIKAKLTIAGLVSAQIEWCKKNAGKRSIAEGNYSKAASSGNYSKAASSGDSSKAASSGDYSTAASSGDSSKAACDINGFACVAGLCGYVKGNAGSALSLGWRDDSGRNRIAVAYVGEGGIEADAWYRFQNGKFVKA